jgi:hypothetical protein
MAYKGLLPGKEGGYLERARALTQRAEALGANLAAWSAVTLAFSWEPEAIEEAVTLATFAATDAQGDREPWACGIAEGTMEELAPQGERAQLAWGTPLVSAVALARVAEHGEVLIDSSVEKVRSGELLVVGSKIATDVGRRVRGARLDVEQPWKSQSAAQIARLVEPPLIGRDAELATLRASPGAVVLLRADPGLGGSRLLSELRARVSPSRALVLVPSSVRVEPLGALRRAFTHVAGSEPLGLDASLHTPLDRLLDGEGVDIDTAASLIVAYLTGRSPQKTAYVSGVAPPPALLIDDALDMDAPSLEACAVAATRAPSPWHVVLRVDAMAELPAAFDALPRGPDIECKPLGAALAEKLAELSTGGALTRRAATRWARRGGFTPLGVLEAITSGLATGELAWVDDVAHARRRAAGRGTPRPASFWIAQRAEELSSEARAVLMAIALLGGEAKLTTIAEVLAHMFAHMDPKAELPGLRRERWVREPQEDWLALPTRTHREAVLQLMHEARTRAWHRAIAEVTESAGGTLRLAEAADHAARAGDGAWAARLGGGAARRAIELGLDTSATRLVAFARSQDPTSEPLLLQATPLSPDPPAVALGARPAPMGQAPPSVARMKAIGELSRGHTAQAVGALRHELAGLSEATALERSKAALALGFALAHAGDTEEALLAALDGLARARESADARGERACMLLVARLIDAGGGEGARVREAAETRAG